MSLEAKIEALTTAVENLTAKMEGGAPAKSTGTAKPKATGTAKAKPKGPTVDDVAEKFATYMNKGSAAAKKKAKVVVKGIVDHFEAERITKIDPDSFPEALKLLEAYEDGEDPLELFGEEEEDDGGMV